MAGFVTQIQIMQKGVVDAIERGVANKRQMTSEADSLYGAVFRAQTVTLQAMAALSAPIPSIHYITLSSHR